jgi:hypothetical protein
MEDHTAFIFTSWMETAWTSEMLVCYHITQGRTANVIKQTEEHGLE